MSFTNAELHDMSLEELKTLRSQVDAAINSYEDRMKKEALAELEEVARKMGYPLKDLLEMASNKKTGKSKRPAKYAHPENMELTWTGMGRKPKWVVEWLDAGKDLDDLLIAQD